MDEIPPLDEQIAIVRSWGWASDVEFVDALEGYWHEVFFPLVDGKAVRQPRPQRPDNGVRIVLADQSGT